MSNSSEIHQEIIEFQGVVNEYLSAQGLTEYRLYYGGHFYTGDLSAADTLFFSINPGFSSEDWPDRRLPSYSETHPSLPISYAEGDYLFARGIREIVLLGDKAKLKASVESCFYSPFATPSVQVLEKTLGLLSGELRELHAKLALKVALHLISATKCKRIVLLGASTFDSFVRKAKLLGFNRDAIRSSEWIKTEDGKRRLYTECDLSNQVRLLSSIHLSAQISSIDKSTLIERYLSEFSEASVA